MAAILEPSLFLFDHFTSWSSKIATVHNAESYI